MTCPSDVEECIIRRRQCDKKSATDRGKGGGGCIGGVIANWPKGVILCLFTFVIRRGNLRRLGSNPTVGWGFGKLHSPGLRGVAETT